ncbi:HNH endonuclease signature motif containing protein [Haloactinopolyspora alba]|nr:HNH endonuclease signature motif containing protein [Haloactinopolyspora alba]
MSDDDTQTPADGTLATLLGRARGPELAALLAGLDVEALSAHELVLVLQAQERLKAHVEAVQVDALAELCERPEYARCSCPVDVVREHRPVEPAGDEVSLALACTASRAKNRVTVAVELRDVLPDTLDALRRGLIDADKARLITERTRSLDTPARQTVQAAVLLTAGRRTHAQLDRALRHEVIAADPGAAETRRRSAAQRRQVSRPEPAGPDNAETMAVMSLYGPVEDLTALFTALDAAARHAREHGDERSLDQLRFDTLTGLGWTGLDLAHLGCCNPTCTTNTASATSATSATTGPNEAARADGTDSTPGTDGAARADNDHRDDRAATPDRAPGGNSPGGTGGSGDRGEIAWLGRRHGKAAAVGVTVAASTLFGADEQPGRLDGFGPITAEAARRIAGEGPWRRLLTDPATGELLEYGRSTYHPPPHLATFVIARDQTCRLPTCERPASEADIDHKQPYHHGGSTGASNNWPLHPGHHLGKTHHSYRIHTDTHGTTWWTTPAGHQYPVEPETIGPLVKRLARDRPAEPAETAPF